MDLRNCKRRCKLSISFAIFTSLILAYYAQPVFSQAIGGVDLNKIPGLENFTGFNNGVPETLDDGTQDANNGVPETLDDGTQDANNGVPELDDAPDEPNPNQVKISFSGSVTQMDDRSNLLYGNVKVGTPVSGEYTYRFPTKDTNTDQTVGDYPHDRKAFGIMVNVGGMVFKTDPKNVNFLVELVNRDTDHYLLRSYNNLPLSDTVPVEHTSWQLDDETGTALLNDSLKSAPIPPILQNWKDPFGLTITGDGPDRGPLDSFFIRAHIDSVNRVS
jgi:hypothetical protein